MSENTSLSENTGTTHGSSNSSEKPAACAALQPAEGMRHRVMLVAGGTELPVYRLHLFDENGILASFDWLTDTTGQDRAWVAVLLRAPIVAADNVRYNDALLFYVRHPAQIGGATYVDVYVHERLLPVERISAQPAGPGNAKRMRYMYRVAGTDACFVTWDTGLEQLRSTRMEKDAQAMAAQCASVADAVNNPRDAWLL